MPRRPPKNHGATFAFHVLFEDLFNPLTENLKKPTGAQLVRGRRAGPHGGLSQSPHEKRRAIIERFFSRWRQEVGDDIYPALRLILPEKDRDRAMYGLKEKALAKYLVKIMKIDKNSEDAYNLINWKQPGQNTSHTAGDFAGRVYEVISKRAMRIDVGDMTIEEVNRDLTELSLKSKDEDQIPILEGFYRRMNAEEMMWLVRVILRNMRVGATERTFLDIWNPDAEALFNVCSSLRRVCHELYRPNIRLEREERGVCLMQCYQPQLAFFNEKKAKSYASMVKSMKMTEDDQEFWIEEKLDGERMQLHMTSDPSVPGGKKFKFWSRKAKDYTYLYGGGFEDDGAALTLHLKDAFADGVENIILDGEMITWDPQVDAMVPFGTLKTAALEQSRNPYGNGMRPFYRVFDILYLNSTDLTQYTLRDRRKALHGSIRPVHRRMEILEFAIAHTAEEIETRLQKVIEEASEGLVLKNPRSAYKLNDRHDDWVKVKPEYMQEFGESLDCLIIGGYYGSGHRGGALSSFLCGLRDDRRSSARSSNQTQPNEAAQTSDGHKFLSFFKVGGGMTRDDYTALRHHTEGKWRDWDPKRPPVNLIELAGGNRQVEKPDQWIKPEDSMVVEVKAASITTSDEYATNLTLRFPRFKRFRPDKDWQTALTFQQFKDLKENVEEEHASNERRAQEEARKSRPTTGPGRSKKPLTVAGYEARDSSRVQIQEPKSNIFAGLNIFVMTEATKPFKKSKVELEELIKANGGRIVQGTDVRDESKGEGFGQAKGKSKGRLNLKVLCVAERQTVKVASLLKRGQQDVVRPTWLFDCIEQGRKDFAKGLEEMIIPFELERHLFFTPEDRKETYTNNVDEYGDSYARDVDPEELKQIMSSMGTVEISYDEQTQESLAASEESLGNIFTGLKLYFDPLERAGSDQESARSSHAHSIAVGPVAVRHDIARRMAIFAGAVEVDQMLDESITHMIVHPTSNTKEIRKQIATRRKVPRIVTPEWIEHSWSEKTRIDEERYAPIPK